MKDEYVSPLILGIIIIGLMIAITIWVVVATIENYATISMGIGMTAIRGPVKDVTATGKRSAVLVVGDSLAAGVGSSESEDIPSQLMELSKRPVDTLAVSGLRTKDITKMLKTSLPNSTKGYEGVVLIAGGNDVVFLTKTPISDLEKDFEELIREGLKHVSKNGKVYVLQPPDIVSVPLFKSLRMTMTTSASIKALSLIQERVVEKMRSEGHPVILVSLAHKALNGEHFALDGMHLSSKGNSVVANALFVKMKE